MAAAAVLSEAHFDREVLDYALAALVDAEEEDDDSVDAPPPQDVPTPQPGATLDSPIDFTQEAADDARGRPRRRGAGEIDGYCPARIAALPQHAHKRARLE